jgi:hypothetical protein
VLADTLSAAQRKQDFLAGLAQGLDADHLNFELCHRRAHDARERVTASRDLARMDELGVIEKDPAAGGRSTRYRIRLSESLPSRLIKELNWT